MAPTNAPNGARVLLAMSGGVDSSTSAALLLEAGYEVCGLTMRLFDEGQPGISAARAEAAEKDIDDARRVCAQLGIEHCVCDLADTFARKVIDPFCARYLAGATPNPCVTCNRRIKFGALHEMRREGGFNYLATGHYARIVWDEGSRRPLLARARDASKDQSYVLYHLSPEQLAHTLFPLGDYEKARIRQIAAQHGFGNADKAESQDICFIDGSDYASFIRERTGCAFEPGDIVDREGRVLGRHEGLARYTVGQRKGIGVAAGAPLYVRAKDAASNRLVVGFDEDTRCQGIRVEDVRLIMPERIAAPARLSVKTHYRQTPLPATVELTGEREARVLFDEPHRACAPGQAAVLFDGDLVVGGGTIAASIW